MRENGFRAIGGLAQRLTSGIAAHRGKGGRGASIARLRAEWTAIVGPDLARITRPEALLASRGARAGARAGKALRLRVPGASALEVQHKTGQLVERVNAYFGHRMIDDIRLVQGADRRAGRAQAHARARSRNRDAGGRTGRFGEGSRAQGRADPPGCPCRDRPAARAAGRRWGRAVASAATCAPRTCRATSFWSALPGDHILGKPDAPNTLIDYASFTCPHCANFYIAVMPTLRKEWIDTGRLRLIHRHFPSDLVATRASQLTECAPPDKFFAMVELLFRKQVDWLSVGDPEVEMVKVLASQGVTPEGAQACFANDRLLDKVLADVQSGQALGVRFTPTLFINEENYANPGGADAIAAILRQVGR